MRNVPLLLASLALCLLLPGDRTRASNPRFIDAEVRLRECLGADPASRHPEEIRAALVRLAEALPACSARPARRAA